MSWHGLGRGGRRPLALLAAALVLLLAASALPATDRASLRRGEQLFMEDCAGCHSLKYLRYERMQRDLGASPQAMREELTRLGVRPTDTLTAPMTAPIAAFAFGKLPPDLSLEVNVRGRAWVRQYLDSFYLDPASSRGWNNPLLPGVAMPNPFWRSQGIRGDDGHGRPGAWLVPGQLKPEAFQRQLDDLLDFLQYAATPDQIQRHRTGPWVLVFLALFTALAYALKRAWWRDLAAPGNDA